MSDPTIQTFCCHRTGQNEEMAIRIMNEFNTDTYNVVCLASSFIGILGAAYQILSRVNVSPERYIYLSSARGRQIIVWLAVADLLASLGVLIRSSLWLELKNIMPLPDDNFSVLFCSIISAWTQYFYTASWLWTLFYAVDTYLILRGRDSHMGIYHSLSWGVPVLTTSVGLSILYIPNATCHNLNSITAALFKILPNYCATYLPIALVMIANPIFYILAGGEAEIAVALPLAQFTSRERKMVDILKLKFLLINLVFYACWLPNLVNGILIWTMWFNMPVKVIIGIWYIMALMNPMQALLNALVYSKWHLTRSYVHMPEIFKKFHFNSKDHNCDENTSLLASEGTRLPLAPMLSRSSINNYATL